MHIKTIGQQRLLRCYCVTLYDQISSLPIDALCIERETHKNKLREDIKNRAMHMGVVWEGLAIWDPYGDSYMPPIWDAYP